MSGFSGARSVSRCIWGLALGLLLASQAQAFEAFDGRLQAHGFYEMQLRAMNADYSEDWDATQWYNVFNLELELDLLQDTVGILDLLSAYVRAEVRYDCIYSSGCGMFRSMNTYGDRSKSLPRRLSNATSQVNSGEIPIRNEGRISGSTTDPVPLSEVAGFNGIAETDGAFIFGSRVPCLPGNPDQNRPGLNCFPDGQNGTKPFDYVFEQFADFRFSMVNFKGGSGSGNPIQILGPWLPSNRIETTNAAMADRVNPFDNSRLNPVLNCRFPQATVDCFNARLEGNGARPFRPIPAYAEDRSRSSQKIQVVVYDDATDPARADPNNPATYRVIEVDTQYNHGDARFNNGTRELFLTVSVPFPGDDPNDPASSVRIAYDARDLTRSTNVQPVPNTNFLVPISGDRSLTPITNPTVIAGRNAAPRLEFVNGKIVQTNANTQARGLFVPSKPLRQIMQRNNLRKGSWALNLTENERQWNRGLAQKDEKELKEAYLDIEMFDSQLWLRIGKQQIVWGKTELFRTTDQFNPQDLALATLPSLEESRIALWSVRGIWSFYEVGPLEDVRVEVAVNIDDYESSDFGSCGEPYVVNLVCSANFGAFAHSFTGIGIVGIEENPDPWQSLKGWEIGGRIEWRWDRFSFALSDFWGYADLPTIRRVSTYERNVDPQTGRPLIYSGIDPDLRRPNHSLSYAQDTSTRSDMTTSLWSGIGNGNDPWEDPYGDLLALIDDQQADPTGVASGDLPFARDPAFFVARGTQAGTQGRINCGTTRTDSGSAADNIRYYPRPTADNDEAGTIDGGINCLTAGPTQLFDSLDRSDDSDRVLGFDPTDPRCTPIDTNGDGSLDTVPSTCPYQPTNALDSHHANLTLFTWLCSATVGFLDLDKTACAQTVFGSTEEPAASLAVSEIIGRILGGDPLLNALLILDNDITCDFNSQAQPCDLPVDKGSKFLPYALPIVQLSNDPGDNDSLGCQDFQFENLPPAGQVPCGGTNVPITYLAVTLSPEQEALLGCGPFWGTNCDRSGIDLLNMEPSIVLQAFAGASGSLTAVSMKQQGIRPPGTSKINPRTGQPLEFRDRDEYRTDEGLQPGTLPWEVAGIGGPLCSTADIGGNLYPRGQEKVIVPGAVQEATRPASRKEALPGCHRKWVDRQNGYLNLAWGQPEYLSDGNGNLIPDPVTGLPLQRRDASTGAVLIDYFYYSGDPDPLGVVQDGSLSYPDSVFYQTYGTDFPGQNLLFSSLRPAIGPGHPFASQRAVSFANPALGPGNPELIVPFASELAGLSWNFQMIGVAFSEEFQNALETVGDLADPRRSPCRGFQTYCGANLEGGSIPTGSASNPNTLGSNRRLVAQMLYGYCGSDYGTGDSNQDLNSIDPSRLGSCRIEGLVNAVPELRALYQAEGINPLDAERTQAYLDSLQFANVAIVLAEDATADTDQFEGAGPGGGQFATGNEPATGRFNIIRNEHCSFITPQYCSTVRNLFFLAGMKRNTLAAGGNGAYGRRTMQWHSGGEVTLYVPKRNVLGFAMDFAEDRTKSNFSIETTWIENVPTGSADEWDNQKRTDEFNLTVSVDRPTFVNFLNPNRTLFINSQWFFQYRRGVKKGFGGNGPFNALATLTVFTGYFQDRLNPSLTFVHDIQSGSGGVLPSVNYRFSENFSATIGLAMFYGREQRADIATNGIGPAGNEAGDWAYETGAQNGISIVRDRDEVFLKLRYTF
jgi:hypothetical protein